MSGKQAKRRREADRELIPRALREHNDLARHLAIQLDALRISAKAYDDGFEDEARRLATVIRVLVHDTGHSQSLLGQLGIKERLQWQNYGDPVEDDNLMPQVPGLFIWSTGTDRARYKPKRREDVESIGREPALAFSAWWTAPASRLPGKRLLSRKDYVLMASDREGGAHVDPRVTEPWDELENDDPFGHGILRPDGAPWRFQGNAALAAIRTISEEVLDTLQPLEKFLPGRRAS